MSVARNFRVTVNLSNFFHDHRNRARIFINNDIQKISDLEERIEKIFNIQNFHLTSQNEFLPPSEDARILQKDDIIWVIHNGDHYDSTNTPIASSRNVNKSKTIEERKSPISLPEELVEEELKPLKKKKKKKYNLERSEENMSSPINYEPKKKKKKKDKTCDTIEDAESMNNMNMEILSSSPQPKTKNRSKVNISTTTSTEDELNSSKTNCMNINTLLPVLQSHINTYNKKMSTTQSKKASTSTEVCSSFSKKNNSDDEKSQYICKGNLPFYKKKTYLPTTTQEYLNKKKINIVKIEYVSGGSPNKSSNEKDTLEIKEGEKNENPTSEICTVPTVEEHDKDNIKDDCVPSRILSYTGNNFPIEGITPLRTPNSSEALNMNKSVTMPNVDSKKLEEQNRNSDATNTLSDDTFASDKQNSKQKESNKSECDDVDKKFITNESTEPFCPSKGSPRNEVSKSSVSPTPCKISTPIDIHKTGDTDAMVDTKVTILKEPAMLCPQKYFFSKGLDDDNTDHEENLPSSQNSYSEPTKQNLFEEAYDRSVNDGTQAEGMDIEYTPSQIENPDLKSDPISSESAHPDSKRNTDNLDFPHANHTDLDMRPSYNPTEDTPLVDTALDQKPVDDSQRASKCYPENLVTDSKVEISNISEISAMDLCNSKVKLTHSDISDISAMDLTTSVPSKVDNSQIGKVRRNNTSRYTRNKQESGIGQLLEELRSNDSIASFESLESDCSEFITKRSRKRVRKKKKKNVEMSSPTASSNFLMVESPVQLRALNLKSGPAKHIKFVEDEDGDELKAIDITKQENTHVPGDSYIECVSLRSDLEESKTERPNIRVEDILKSPSMNKMLPKVADLIAFKILRISQNYTPEVSTFIVGKVLEFNTVNKHILFEILSGLDLCQDQTTFAIRGDLFLEMGGGVPVESLGNRREFMWIDLIDPRLLYP